MPGTTARFGGTKFWAVGICVSDPCWLGEHAPGGAICRFRLRQPHTVSRRGQRLVPCAARRPESKASGSSALIWVCSSRGRRCCSRHMGTRLRAPHHLARRYLWSWLARICRGVCVDRIRSRRAEHLLTTCDERLPSALVPELTDPIGEGFQSQGFGDWIDDQIRSFPPSQRNAAALRWLVQWPVKKIAETLGVTPGTVKTELFRARRTIARRLADPQVIATLGMDPQLLDRYVGEHEQSAASRLANGARANRAFDCCSGGRRHDMDGS